LQQGYNFYAMAVATIVKITNEYRNGFFAAIKVERQSVRRKRRCHEMKLPGSVKFSQ
jgi:hypothetical protein